MGNTSKPHSRAFYIPLNNYITIEPILDFDLNEFCTLLKLSSPKQINIGADTGKNNLPEPSKKKVLDLIEALKEFTKVEIKTNLNRIINS